MKATVREKGKTLQQSGGLVLTTDTWLAPKIEALNEIQEFDRRYALKMAELFGLTGASVDQAVDILTRKLPERERSIPS